MKKWDKLIIFFMIIFNLLLIVFFYSNKSEAVFKIAIVKVDGNLIKEIPLNKENKGSIYNIESKYGKNVLLVENGTIRVIEASCPDKLDVKQGSIKNVGDKIICLPNRMIIEIISGEEVEMDGISK